MILKKILSGVIVTILLAIILYEPIRKLIKFDGLYAGGENGFWNDTVISIVQTSLYGKSYSEPTITIACYFIAIILITVLGIILFRSLKSKTLKIDMLALSFLLLVLPAFVSIMQHYIVGSKFLVNRMTLFFIPLFSLQLISLTYYCFQNGKKIISSVFTIGISIVFLTHTFLSSNFSYFLSWKFDSQTKKC